MSSYASRRLPRRSAAPTISSTLGGGGVARNGPFDGDAVASGRPTNDRVASSRPERVEDRARGVGRGGQPPTVTDVSGDETGCRSERNEADRGDDDRHEQLDNRERRAHGRQDALTGRWERHRSCADSIDFTRYAAVTCGARANRNRRGKPSSPRRGSGARDPPTRHPRARPAPRRLPRRLQAHRVRQVHENPPARRGHRPQPTDFPGGPRGIRTPVEPGHLPVHDRRGLAEELTGAWGRGRPRARARLQPLHSGIALDGCRVGAPRGRVEEPLRRRAGGHVDRVAGRLLLRLQHADERADVGTAPVRDSRYLTPHRALAATGETRSQARATDAAPTRRVRSPTTRAPRLTPAAARSAQSGAENAQSRMASGYRRSVDASSPIAIGPARSRTPAAPRRRATSRTPNAHRTRIATDNASSALCGARATASRPMNTSIDTSCHRRHRLMSAPRPGSETGRQRTWSGMGRSRRVG